MSDETHTTLPDVPLVEREGEPRARDVDIAERLGFERPRKIRELIERNRPEFEALGGISPYRGAKIGRGRPEEGYLLNEEQALLAATLSQAPNASAVRAMLIRTFVAWRRGHLAPAALDMRAVGDMIDGYLSRHFSARLPALVREQLAAELARKDAVPALDFGGTVSAYQVIEAAGIPVEDRQRGTAQMVTRRLVAFCAERRIACFRTPAEVNPSRPFRFPRDVVSEWLLGTARGLELIRSQVDRMKAKKAARGRGVSQGALRLV